MRSSVACWVAAAVVVLAGCGSDTSGSGSGDVDPGLRYVALGDSYSSGGGIGETDPDSGDCQRSELSYPSLVADELGADLTDVACSAAGTASAYDPQPLPSGGSAPPQLDAVTRRAELVTVGLGYNDSAFFLHLVFGCAQMGPSDPAGDPCRAATGGSDLGAATAKIGESVRALLEAIHRRAPDAQVLLVGYPQLVPGTGTCPDLPLAAGDYAFVRDGLHSLDDALRQAAADADATFVDVWTASEGHDICAGEDAWVNGSTNRPGVAALYHPFAAGQRGVAELVLDALAG